jgi:hypothetical protein
MCNIQKTKKQVYGVLILLSFVLLASCKGEVSVPKGSVSPDVPKSSAEVKNIKIDYPVNDAIVTLAETIKGSSQLELNNKKIWIIIFPLLANKYYPQDRAVDMQVDGRWSSVAYIGEKDRSSGEKFDIIAVVVDEGAQKTFSNYINASKVKNEYLGLDMLPEGAQVYDRITVTRK